MEHVVEYIHIHERGLIKMIAEKHGMSITQVRHRLMEDAVNTVHLVLREVFGDKWYSIKGLERLELWIYAMKLVLPYYWALVHKKQDFVDPDEVVSILPKTVAEKLRDMKHILDKIVTVLEKV